MGSLVQVDGAVLDIERAKQVLASCVTVDAARGVRDKAAAVALYLRASKASHEAQAAAAEICLRAEHRMGGILRQTSPGPGRPGKSAGGAFLSPLGLSASQSSKAQKLAALDNSELDSRLEAIRSKGEIPTRVALMTTAAPGWSTDDYGTPGELLERARTLMGGIDLDPASNEKAQTIVQAKVWYDKTSDGLASPWVGQRLWLNPPYSAGLIDAFTERFRMWPFRGILLVNASTDTEWFHALLEARVQWLLTKGRISFLGPDGEPLEGNRVGQAFFFMGFKHKEIKEVFGSLGYLNEPWVKESDR